MDEAGSPANIAKLSKLLRASREAECNAGALLLYSAQPQIGLSCRQQRGSNARKIFISYRREESAANALSIGQYLENEFGRRNVFIDVDMSAGTKFPAILDERLKTCKVMLALIGPNWATATDDEGCRRLANPDDWVRLEIARALERVITVIPVRINGTELPKKSTLPEDIQGLLDHQATNVTTTGFRNDMAGLVRDIRKIPNPRRSRRLAIGGSALLLLFLIPTVGLWNANSVLG